jgi:hypothetical protein
MEIVNYPHRNKEGPHNCEHNLLKHIVVKVLNVVMISKRHNNNPNNNQCNVPHSFIYLNVI